MTKLLIIVGVIVALLGLYLGFGSKYFQNTQPQKYTGPVEKVTVCFPLAGAELNTLIFVANDKGYFKEQGLEVSMKDAPSTLECQKDLIEGRIDLAGATDYTVAVSGFNTKNIKVIAVIDKGQQVGITARRDKGIAKPSDLKEKRIGIVPKTVSEFYLYQFLIEHGIPAKDVQIVSSTPGKIISDLENGTIDAFSAGLLLSYNASKSLKEAGVISWFSQESNSFYWLLTSTQDTLSKRPLVVERFLGALVSAEDSIKADKQDAQAIVKKRYSDKGQDYFDFVWPKHNFKVSLEQAMLLAMENQARWAIKNKLTDKTKVPNYLDYIYFDALEKVKPEAMTIVH